MIITITFILSFLVALNFLLLIISCNKTTKRNASESHLLVTKSKPVQTDSPNTQIATNNQLAPTGS